MNDFILNEAPNYSKAMISVTYVIVDNLSAKDMGIGTYLISFIKGLYKQSNRAGCRFVTVDAYNTATPFYEKNGFILLTKKENTGTTTPLYYYLKFTFSTNKAPTIPP